MQTALERLRQIKAVGTTSEAALAAVEERAGESARPAGRAAMAARMPLARFAAAGLIVPIFSEVVGEKVYFLSDNAQATVSADGLYRGCIVYRAQELQALLGADAETVRLVHAVKRAMGGVVVGADE